MRTISSNETNVGSLQSERKGSKRATALLDTEREAIRKAKQLNPNDKPDVERVRNTNTGGRDQWRSGR
jgi:hypothetical protein